MKRLSLVIAIGLLVSLALPSVAAAEETGGWSTNPGRGTPICTVPGNQGAPIMVSDGSGGAIVVWVDYRKDVEDSDLYAQRLDAKGEPQWQPDGVTICDAPGEQAWSAIVSDGSGGAIVAWRDARDGKGDIYAQKVNSEGATMWTLNGVVICTDTGAQRVVVVEDGSGGAIMAWEDYKTTDIYAQRVSSDGVVQWRSEGMTVCAAEGDRSHPAIVTDGDGGAIITWSDSLSSILAQRIGPTGTAKWDADGVAVCAAAGRRWPDSMASDWDGGAIISWTESGGNWIADIYAQRVNASGIPQWAGNGTVICSAPGVQALSRTTGDGSGGAVIAWRDMRSSGDWDIYTQRVSASGMPQWTTDGVPVCTAAHAQSPPLMQGDTSGGAVIAWEDERSGTGSAVYAQRLGAGGKTLWAADGVTVYADEEVSWAEAMTMIDDDHGGALFAWERHTKSGDSVLAQRVDSSGILGSGSGNHVGFPIWAWIAIAVGVVGILTAGFIVWRRTAGLKRTPGGATK